MTAPAPKWRKTSARFSGTIAGRFARFEAGNFIYGKQLAAVWKDGEHWHFIAKDGTRGRSLSMTRAQRYASGDIYQWAQS